MQIYHNYTHFEYSNRISVRLSQQQTSVRLHHAQTYRHASVTDNCQDDVQNYNIIEFSIILKSLTQSAVQSDLSASSWDVEIRRILCSLSSLLVERHRFVLKAKHTEVT